MEALFFNNPGLLLDNLPLSEINLGLFCNNLPLSFNTRALLSDKRNPPPKNISTLGAKCSHTRKKIFPPWEYATAVKDKMKRRTAFHDTAFEGPRYAVSMTVRRRIGDYGQKKNLYRQLCCRGKYIIKNANGMHGMH